MNGDLNVLQAGPVHTVLTIAALSAMVLAALIWVMEFSGWTITRRGFARNHVSWDATTMALTAVSAALYIAGRPLQFQLIPGVGGVNPSLSLAPVFAVLFGLPGAIGVTFSMPIGDALSGALTVGSVAGCLSHTFITWLPYKMVREPDFKKPLAIASFYLWAIVVGPLIHTIVIPAWLDLTHVLPGAVAWGALPAVILLNHSLTPAVVSPVLMMILYPVVKSRGLYWRDRLDSPRRTALDPMGTSIYGASSNAPIVAVDDLRFWYPTREEAVLKGVTFTIARGEFIGITGPSGAGKTTLALCLRGLIPHTIAGRMEGNIAVSGVDTRAVHPAALGEHVGLVFQDAEAQIVGLTVAEDLAFGPENYEWPPERIRAAIPDLLRMVGLDGLQDRETFGLSGGQKQRVALASALMMAPDLLILDEPTSELDPAGKEEVFEALRRLKVECNTTVIVIEHAVEQLADCADRIFVMDQGRIIAQGAPREVFSRVDVFHRTGGERLPAAAELLFALQRDGVIPADEFAVRDGEAVSVVSRLLSSACGECSK